jgi:two-component sensor histidine kinase
MVKLGFLFMEAEMNCRMGNYRDKERLAPPNREVALCWTLHEALMNAYKFAHLPDAEQRKREFEYSLNILKLQVDGYFQK